MTDPALALYTRLSAVVTDQRTIVEFVRSRFPAFVKPKGRA